jgi:2-iminobutanoate/2-iminopropanoate deaminase
MRQSYSSPDAPAEQEAYSHASEANGFVFTAGQVPMRQDGSLVAGDVTEKTHQIMQNLGAILTEAGTGFENVVRVTAYFTDIDDFHEMDRAYAEYFDDDPPARDVIEVEDLPAGAEIELVMTAALTE